MNINFLWFYHSRPIYNPHIPPWAYPNGFVGLNVKLEHMTRVYYSELLAKNALKAEEIKISVLIPLCYYRELHIQISERFRALLDLKVGVRIGVTFPTVTLAADEKLSAEIYLGRLLEIQSYPFSKSPSEWHLFSKYLKLPWIFWKWYDNYHDISCRMKCHFIKIFLR